MANFFFDGSANVLAQKADNVLITANPALFVSQAQVGANVVLTYNNGTTITVQGTTLGDNTTNLPGVQLSTGTFSTGATAAITATTQNDLIFAPNAGTNQINVDAGGTAASVKTVFGGNGVSDSTDTADAIVIGGKGSFLIYGNAGADTITQTTAFDSTSFVTVFGGKNDVNGLLSDTITLDAGANANAKMAIYGGEGTDTITVVNTGSNANTAIFGGQGAADSTDSADIITFNGGGVVNVYGNAGNDTITLGGTGGLDSTATATVHGGIGGDNVTVLAAGAATKINIVAFGDENTTASGADSITVAGNGGNTQIFGGTFAADSADGADIINYSGQGTANIFAAGGDDTIIVNTSGTTLTAAGSATGSVGTGVTSNTASVTNVFAGNGNDTISILNSKTETGITNVAGGAGNDTYIIGASDSTVVNTTGYGNSIFISDFGTAGIDRLQINNQTANTAGGQAAPIAVTASAASGYATLTDALNAAANVGAGTPGTAAAGTVGIATFNGDTYVVLSNGTVSGYQAGTDLAIKLTGVTSATAVQPLITII